MLAFNSYVVFDEEGNLIAQDRETNNTPESYFKCLSGDIQRRAYVLLVLQEYGYVARYMVTQPSILTPILGSRERLQHKREGA